jgi:ATP-dependent Clp protease ATP-binding subunit ClpA
MLDRLMERFRAPGAYRSAPTYSPGATINDARDEARRRGDRKIGTEHLLLALLQDPASAQALGCALETGRQALDALDRAALGAVGMSAVPEAPPVPGQERARLPLTPAAKAVLIGAMKERARARLGPEHVLLALLLRERPDPAAELLAALGVDRAVVRQRLTRDALAGETR